jgi:hypothetical protein
MAFWEALQFYGMLEMSVPRDSNWSFARIGRD